MAKKALKSTEAELVVNNLVAINRTTSPQKFKKKNQKLLWILADRFAVSTFLVI